MRDVIIAVTLLAMPTILLGQDRRPIVIDFDPIILGLIRFRGHLLKGSYDVHNGRNEKPAASPAI